MPATHPLLQLNQRILACEQCPRLVAHCRQVAREKRRAYLNEEYHGKPVPNFLPPLAATSTELRGSKRREKSKVKSANEADTHSKVENAENIRMLIVGLAPGAHGANRTGRMFTGDRFGDFLYRALHETEFASQPTATRFDDGLTLRGAAITAACHCAPPDNKPLPDELARCSPWLEQTFDLLPGVRVVVCLGGLALEAVLRLYQRRGWIAGRSAYRFGHGARFDFPCEPGMPGPPIVLCSYHPSQQNTFTGRLTAPMLRDIFERAREICR